MVNMLQFGLMWMAIGLIPDNFTFFIIGLVFMLVGVSHRKEWANNRKRWKDLTKKEQKIKVVLITILTIGIVAGTVVMLLRKGGLA